MKLKKYLGIILSGAISVSIVGCSTEETYVESGSATHIEEKQEQTLFNTAVDALPDKGLKISIGNKDAKKLPFGNINDNKFPKSSTIPHAFNTLTAKSIPIMDGNISFDRPSPSTTPLINDS